jgi:2-keto-4-pentenoate hydratase
MKSTLSIHFSPKTRFGVRLLGYTLQPDQFVSNGALGKIIKAEPGSYEADFGPLGAVVFDVIGE